MNRFKPLAPLRFLSALIVSLTVVGAGNAVALDVFPGKEPVRVGLETEDLIVHRMDDEFYTESWYFMGDLQDGGRIFLHFGLSNAGFGDFTGAVEATVIDADGKIHFEKTTVKKDKITYNEKSLDIDFDGRHSLKGNPGQFVMKSEGDEVSFDLVVTPQAPGLRFGDGRTWFGDDKQEFYDFAILTPKGVMEGSVTTEGKKQSVKGYSYGDHAWQNYPAHKMADRLFSMRGFNGDTSASFLVFRTSEFSIPTLVLTQENKVVLATTNIDIEESNPKQDEKIRKYQIAEKLAITSRSGGPEVSGTIDFNDRLQRQDPTKEFSFFERTLIKMFVAKPILYRYANDYSFTLPAGETPTVLEGKGVVEAMILRVD